MSQTKIIVLVAMAIALLMVLFPPWSVRERMYFGAEASFAPEASATYAFIAHPPTERLRNSPLPYKVATVDLTRRCLQFVALAILAGGSIVASTMLSDAERAK